MIKKSFLIPKHNFVRPSIDCGLKLHSLNLSKLGSAQIDMPFRTVFANTFPTYSIRKAFQYIWVLFIFTTIKQIWNSPKKFLQSKKYLDEEIKDYNDKCPKGAEIKKIDHSKLSPPLLHYDIWLSVLSTFKLFISLCCGVFCSLCVDLFADSVGKKFTDFIGSKLIIEEGLKGILKSIFEPLVTYLAFQKISETQQYQNVLKSVDNNLKNKFDYILIESFKMKDYQDIWRLIKLIPNTCEQIDKNEKLIKNDIKTLEQKYSKQLIYFMERDGYNLLIEKDQQIKYISKQLHNKTSSQDQSIVIQEVELIKSSEQNDDFLIADYNTKS